MSIKQEYDYDYIIIGSGFGGSVSALRLAEKGYRVLVLEKGKRLMEKDFPATNWNLKKWLWLPALRLFGFFRISFFRHITILSGAGVGGGSLVYANCLQVPKSEFFTAESWAHLADWEQELKEYYDRALNMLGAVPNPRFEVGDKALRTLAEQIGKADRFEPTRVSVFFGEPEVTVPDPYFGGAGPARAGCVFCGGCMVGCRYNAKNTLDKNYLYLAEQSGVVIQAESEVYDVIPPGTQGGSGSYRVKWRSSTSWFKRKGEYSSRGIVFAGGVLGTNNLLLKLRRSSLPNLSAMTGANIRTNSEAVVCITTRERESVCSDGIAIGSIMQTDDHSFLEPVRYPAGSGFWRMLVITPMVHGKNVLIRIARVLSDLIRYPFRSLRVYFVRDWAKRTQILVLMQTLDGTLRFRRGIFGMRSSIEKGKSPTAFIPEARDLANRYSAIVNGKPMVLITEALLGNPTTAHILGGAVMGGDREEGVIDRDNRVFGYEHMYVCDGSMISANLGVNPSLTITALSERAMSKIPPKT